MDFEPFEIPLQFPLPGSGERVRRGYYLHLDGAIGEVAPLPGWSSETLEQARADLQRLAKGDSGGLCASVQFGWECALQEKIGWADFPPLAREISISALDGDIESALAAGCRCFKFKLAGDPRAMAEMIKERAEKIHGRAAIRLDANRRWSLAEASEFLNLIPNVPYQYLEEPVCEAKDLAKLIGHPSARLALDETLREISPDDLPKWTGVRAVVLKPTLLGGLKISRDFARAAERLGALPVVSASFESRIGLGALVRFAASLSPKPEPAGLDTARWLPANQRGYEGNYRTRIP